MRRLKSIVCTLCLFVTCLSAHAKILLQGQTYYSLPEVAAMLGMQFKWLEPKKEAELASRWTKIIFQIHKRDITLNGRRVFLGSAVTLHDNTLWITQNDYQNSLAPILTPRAFKGKQLLRHIVIDPGHGGKDEGTTNKAMGLTEKKLALDLALRIERLLKKAGYKVTLTRRTDTFIPLSKRPEKANELKADLFVSIHFNAVGSQKEIVQGVETYLLPAQNQPSTSRTQLETADKESYPGNKHNTHNMLLAYCIQDSFLSEINSQDRGIKKARFAVLKTLNCPGVLVESGFLTHTQEARKIAQPTHRQKMAQAITEGILRYDRIQKKANET